jgi:hypothetical protein
MNIKTDEVSVDAANRMSREIQELEAAIRRLLKTATVDLSVKHWDGAAATEFRTQLWPTLERSLKHSEEELRTLQRAVQRVLGDILHAGR